MRDLPLAAIQQGETRWRGGFELHCTSKLAVWERCQLPTRQDVADFLWPKASDPIHPRHTIHFGRGQLRGARDSSLTGRASLARRAAWVVSARCSTVCSSIESHSVRMYCTFTVQRSNKAPGRLIVCLQTSNLPAALPFLAVRCERPTNMWPPVYVRDVNMSVGNVRSGLRTYTLVPSRHGVIREATTAEAFPRTEARMSSYTAQSPPQALPKRRCVCAANRGGHGEGNPGACRPTPFARHRSVHQVRSTQYSTCQTYCFAVPLSAHLQVVRGESTAGQFYVRKYGGGGRLGFAVGHVVGCHAERL